MTSPQCSAPRVSSCTLMATSSTCRPGSVRRCSTSTTFASCSARWASSAARWPGESATRTRRETYRPAAARPCLITRSSSRGSTLPPDKTATTGASNAPGSSRMPATAGTPADHLGRRQAQQQGTEERLLRDGPYVVDEVADDLEGNLTGTTDSDPVGHG